MFKCLLLASNVRNAGFYMQAHIIKTCFSLSSFVIPNLAQIKQIVKIADFGVARVKSTSGVMTAETGTYRWMAPEVCYSFWCIHAS